MSTTLVTGAAGFVGAHLVQHFLRSHPTPRLLLLDNFSHGAHPSQMMAHADHHRILSVVGDVRDRALLTDVIRSHDVTRIVHCAALDAPTCQTLDAAAIMDSNVSGTMMLLESARMAWCSLAPRNTHFHMLSCADILVPDADGQVQDDSPGTPESLYAVSRMNAENLALGFAQRYNLRVSISRPVKLFGPRQFPGTGPAAIITAILEGRRIPIHGAGSQTLHLLPVEDAVRIITHALESAPTLCRFGIGGAPITIRDLIGLLCRLVDLYAARSPDFAARFPRSPAASSLPSSTLVTLVQDRRQVTRPRILNFTRAQTLFGSTPHAPLEESLAATVRWYAENIGWWRAVQSGAYQTRMDLALAG